MPRPRQRVCLQGGLKLDLNRLTRKGFVEPGTNIGVPGIAWTHPYWGEIASGRAASSDGRSISWAVLARRLLGR